MSKFDDFLASLQTNLKQYAETSFGAWRDAAVADGESFIAKTKTDMENWTNELAAGQIDSDDFNWLVESKKDLAQLVALKQQGLAAARLDEFFAGLTGVITNTAVSVFL